VTRFFSTNRRSFGSIGLRHTAQVTVFGFLKNIVALLFLRVWRGSRQIVAGDLLRVRYGVPNMRPCSPMRLLRVPEPFDHPEFIFEPKIDGFRALAYVEWRRCRLVSRNGHEFKSWPQLAEEIAHVGRRTGVECQAYSAIRVGVPLTSTESRPPPQSLR
jgi:hypothetical protein